MAGRPGLGKALALDTPLPTPDGWTTMGEVKAGDRLLGADGRPTTVVNAFEVLHDRPCYEVEFSRRLGDRGRRRAPVADHDESKSASGRQSSRTPQWPASARKAVEHAYAETMSGLDSSIQAYSGRPS